MDTQPLSAGCAKLDPEGAGIALAQWLVISNGLRRTRSNLCCAPAPFVAGHENPSINRFKYGSREKGGGE